MPVLSFCLFTADRSRDMDRCLAAIHLDAVHHGVLDQIEICITDNCSTDDTVETCESWRPRFPHFHFLRQPERCHVLNNLTDSAHLATGEYIWLLGDDDLLIPDVLGLVLDTCRQAPDYVHAAGITFSRQDSGCTYIGVKHPRHVAAGPLYANDFVQHGLISTLILRREVWLKSRRFPERHPLEVTTHVQVIADCLQTGRCMAIHTPCVLIEKTPTRHTAWNGYFALMHGYEFFTARDRDFASRPGEKAVLKHNWRVFTRAFGILSLMRDHYAGIYELASRVQARTIPDRLGVAVFKTLFASRLIRDLAIRCLGMVSSEFKNKRKSVENLVASQETPRRY